MECFFSLIPSHQLLPGGGGEVVRGATTAVLTKTLAVPSSLILLMLFSLRENNNLQKRCCCNSSATTTNNVFLCGKRPLQAPPSIEQVDCMMRGSCLKCFVVVCSKRHSITTQRTDIGRSNHCGRVRTKKHSGPAANI